MEGTEDIGSPFCGSICEEESYADILLKFISAQAIQILEGAIVTHSGVLSAFHELKGVDILVRRLHAPWSSLAPSLSHHLHHRIISLHCRHRTIVIATCHPLRGLVNQINILEGTPRGG